MVPGSIHGWCQKVNACLKIFTIIKLCLMLYYVFDCCLGLYNCSVTALSKPCTTIWQRVYYCAKLRMLCYVHICILLYALPCVADIE